MRQGLASATEESFGPLFASRVMKSIDALGRPESSIEVFSGALYRLFRPVAATAAAAAIALVLWNAQAGEKLTPASVLALPENGVEVVWETPLESMLQESS
jgi:hypothetical protein